MLRSHFVVGFPLYPMRSISALAVAAKKKHGDGNRRRQTLQVAKGDEEMLFLEKQKAEEGRE